VQRQKPLQRNERHNQYRLEVDGIGHSDLAVWPTNGSSPINGEGMSGLLLASGDVSRAHFKKRFFHSIGCNFVQMVKPGADAIVYTVINKPDF
jgi:hypothetical protein